MFERIRNKWKEEREKEDLSLMDEGFYGAMRDFIKEREIKTREEQNPLVKKILETRFERYKYIINDLIEIRTAKIIQMVVNNEELTINVAREEREFHESFKLIYDKYRKQIFSPKDAAFVDLSNILGREVIEEETDIIEYVPIRFLKKVKEEITALDGATYGPFESGDICFIPKENAIGFVRKEIAENIELE